METLLKAIVETSSILEAGFLFMSKHFILYTLRINKYNLYSNNSIDINVLECVEKEEF